MDLLLVPVPIFDSYVTVKAYLFRFQKGKDLLFPNDATYSFDSAGRPPLLEILDNVGLDSFTMGQSIFLPVNSLSLLFHLEEQCSEAPDKIIFTLGEDVKPEEDMLERIKVMRSLGYRFALQQVDFGNLELYAPLLALADFVFVNQRTMGDMEWFEQTTILRYLKSRFRHLEVVANEIDTKDNFSFLQGSGFYDLYEGSFYRIPVTKGRNKISPLKINSINLLNMVRNETFEFDQVARFVQRDTALSISLLRMVNSPYLGLKHKVKSIVQAVALLGEVEVRYWIVTAVAKSLGADRPDELSKLSMVRAKFAENLAPKFGLEHQSQSLFLMGLFSMLDTILELPMERALNMVHVSDEIREALAHRTGEFSDLLQFMMDYETADWRKVSRTIILRDLTVEEVFDAYIDASIWYRDLLTETVPTEEEFLRMRKQAAEEFSRVKEMKQAAAQQ